MIYSFLQCGILRFLFVILRMVETVKQKRSYRRRGSPDLLISVYFCDKDSILYNPIPEYHPETEIVRVDKGYLIIQLGGVSHIFHAGDIFVIPSNIVHHYSHASEDAKYCSLIFSPEAIAMQSNHFFQKSFVQPLAEDRLQLPAMIQPGHPIYDGVSAQFDTLPNAHMFTKDYQVRRFSALMNICLLLLPYCTIVSESRPPLDPGNDAVRACMRYIHSRYFQKITLEELAAHCHLHPNYLCSLFKTYTGQTIFEYLARFRIETAAELLKNEDLPASKICTLVGFHSESTFFSKFKAIMGITPKAYAKQHRI